MQTIQRLLTETELQRRTCTLKNLFTGHVLERQSSVRYEYKKKHFSKFRQFENELPLPPLNSM